MAWIESHQSLLTHRKTLRAAALLHVNRYQLIGHLHALWWWGLDNAETDGRLRGALAAEIADAAGWTKEGDFTGALAEAGFLEVDGSDFVIHEWFEFAGKLNVQKDLRRESNRKAQSARRQRLRQQDVSADNADSQQSTVPNPTQPNQTLPATGTRASIFSIYEAVFGTLIPNGIVADRLIEAERERGEDCVRHSMEAAALNGVRSWAYVEKVLERHGREGCDAPVMPKSIEDHWQASEAAQSELERIWQEVDANV